jgi:hypothetical protein
MLVGLMFLSMIVGLTAGTATVLAGHGLLLGLLAYSTVGSLALVTLATAVALRGPDQST